MRFSRLILLSATFASLFSLSQAQQGTFSTTGYAATWAVVDGILEVQMIAQTTGWVAFGYKATADAPGHINTDMIVGRVINGVPTVEDRWSVSFTTPAADTRNDVTLVSGQEVNGETTIIFRKPVQANGDAQDVNLPNANVLVQWAYGGIDGFAQHDGAARGSFIANLRAAEVFSPPTAAPTFAPTLAPTLAPTTPAPTTPAPTTLAPTTPAPTTLAPTTPAPTTPAPTTPAPTTPAPTTPAPTTAAPTTAAPTTAAPTTAAPTTAAPTTAAPTTATPTTAAPTTRAPTTAAPTTVAPTTPAPTTRAPTTAAPTTAAPTTRAPTTAAPTTPEPTAAPTTPLPSGCYSSPWNTYTAAWTVSNGFLEVTMSARTTGWVGFGYKSNAFGGAHRNVDMVIGKVVNGVASIEDRFSDAPRSFPRLDSMNDVQLISGSESNGVTTITFKKPLQTADLQDISIPDKVVLAHWAFGATDTFEQHSSRARGLYFANFLSTSRRYKRCKVRDYYDDDDEDCDDGRGRGGNNRGWNCRDGPRTPSPTPPVSGASRLLNLENGDVQISWQLVSQGRDQLLEFTLSYKTTGWVGLGFVGVGSRAHFGSDMIIASVSGSTVTLTDRNSRFTGIPEEDDRQDVTLVSGSETADRTRITFRRPLDSKDPRDFPLSSGRPIKLIWAYGFLDTPSVHIARGSITVDLLSNLPGTSPR